MNKEMNRLSSQTSQTSQKNSFGSLPFSPYSDPCSNLTLPLSVPQVGVAEGHVNVAGTDNARLKDVNISLCTPSHSLFPEEMNTVLVDQASQSTITTYDTFPLSNPFQNIDISIAKSTQITPKTHASDQANSAFSPSQVECSNTSLDSTISMQSNQYKVYFLHGIAPDIKKHSWKGRIIETLKNGEERTFQGIMTQILEKNPELSKSASSRKNTQQALNNTTNSSGSINIFETVPTLAICQQRRHKRWRIKESIRRLLFSPTNVHGEEIKSTNAQIPLPILPKTKPCLPPMSRENESSQTVQSSEIASTTLGTSPLSTPLKKHHTLIAEFAQITPNALASNQKKTSYVFHHVKFQDTSSPNSNTLLQSKKTKAYFSDIPAHSVEYSLTNLIIECLQNGEELSYQDIIKAIKKRHPEIEKLGMASQLWERRLSGILSRKHYFEVVRKYFLRTSGKPLWRIEKSALANIPYPIIVRSKDIEPTNKCEKTKTLDFILSHGGSEHDSIASTIKPQTAQLSEMESDNPFSRKRLRDIEQDGATLDNKDEHRVKEQRLQDPNANLTPESSSATVCLDDGEELTHKAQEHDQNIDGLYWTTDREEEQKSEWDTLTCMEWLI